MNFKFDIHPCIILDIYVAFKIRSSVITPLNDYRKKTKLCLAPHGRRSARASCGPGAPRAGMRCSPPAQTKSAPLQVQPIAKKSSLGFQFFINRVSK